MNKFVLALVVLLVACALAVFAGVVAVDRIQDLTRTGSAPVVDIYSPAPEDEITTGRSVMLQAVARDPDRISRLEFWLDGQLIKSEQSPWPVGITPLPLAHVARIQQAGQHQLVVRAVDTRGNTGQASMRLAVAEAADAAEPAPYVVQEDDTLEGLAESLGVSPSDITDLNPGLSGDLPPVGEELTLPLPPTEEPGVDLGPAVEPVPLLEPPVFLWDPPAVFPRWLSLPGITDLLSPLPRLPEGLLDIALLEVDGPYDGVFCYVSAGDSPVERVPAAEFLTHLSGNYWDISEWFSGESMLPFMTMAGTVRLRMNCIGFYYTTGGGYAHNLGTVDITRTMAELGSGLVEAQSGWAGRWFRIQFRVRPLADGAGGGGTEYDYLYLTSQRFARDERPLVPAPHVELQFLVYDDDHHVPPPAMDGFLIYRNSTLWRATGPMREEYPVWDEVYETGNCGEVTAFQVVGYQGNPLAPSATLESNRIAVNGYCAPSEELRRWVTVEFNFLKLYDVWSLDHGLPGSLDTRGIVGVPQCGQDGQEPCNLIEVLDVEGSPSALDNFDPVSYGGLNVNGRRVIEMADGIVQFAPQLYYFPIGPWNLYYRHALLLDPTEALSISTDLWDYDVWSRDDPICPATIRYSPEQLTAIMDAGATERRLVTIIHEGVCALEFQFTVEPIPAVAPPPPFVPP